VFREATPSSNVETPNDSLRSTFEVSFATLTRPPKALGTLAGSVADILPAVE